MRSLPVLAPRRRRPGSSHEAARNWTPAFAGEARAVIVRSSKASMPRAVIWMSSPAAKSAIRSTPLFGAAENDRLTGGNGADVFVIDGAGRLRSRR